MEIISSRCKWLVQMYICVQVSNQIKKTSAITFHQEYISLKMW